MLATPRHSVAQTPFLLRDLSWVHLSVHFYFPPLHLSALLKSFWAHVCSSHPTSAGPTHAGLSPASCDTWLSHKFCPPWLRTPGALPCRSPSRPLSTVISTSGHLPPPTLSFFQALSTDGSHDRACKVHMAGEVVTVLTPGFSICISAMVHYFMCHVFSPTFTLASASRALLPPPSTQKHHYCSSFWTQLSPFYTLCIMIICRRQGYEFFCAHPPTHNMCLRGKCMCVQTYIIRKYSRIWWKCVECWLTQLEIPHMVCTLSCSWSWCTRTSVQNYLQLRRAGMCQESQH